MKCFAAENGANQMFHSTQTCGRCGNLVDFRFDFAADFTAQQSVADLPRPFPSRRLLDLSTGEDAEAFGSAMCFCPRCAQPTLIVFRTKRKVIDTMIKNLKDPAPLLGGQDLIEAIEVHPKAPQAQSDPHWPADLRRPFADAQTMLVQNMSPSIIIAVCRTVLDIATKELGGNGRTIMERIDSLKDTGTITAAVADWSHDLRRFGNDATHDAAGTEGDAREFIEFLKVFLTNAFTLPATIRARRQKAGGEVLA
jgi:hypothetical protein